MKLFGGFDVFKGILSWGCVMLFVMLLMNKSKTHKYKAEALMYEHLRDSIQVASQVEVARLTFEIQELKEVKKEQANHILRLSKINDSLAEERQKVKIIYLGNAAKALEHNNDENEQYWRNDFD